jgi:predicted aminopeptidase
MIKISAQTLACHFIFKFIPQFLCGGLLSVGLASGLSSCSSVQYLYQAGKGQLEIQNKARPLDDVIRDETTPPHVRALLIEIPAIKKFGVARSLKATPNYQEYVKLDRSAASYVVSACEPLRFEAKNWSFPIVGSFPYLGFFSLSDAKKYAEKLKAEGLDVDLRGASAYSTLGWFRDPILSTMLPAVPGDPAALGDLVNVVLHESTHATLYISGQSSFNETLAMFVAGKMTIEYFEATRGKASPELKAYRDSEKRGDEIVAKLHDAYGSLEKLYASSRPDEEKRTEKKDFLTKLQLELGFKREINNATLIGYRTYDTSTDAFEKVYQACGADWRRFFKALARPVFSESQQTDLNPVLLPIAQAGCPLA